MRTFWWESDRRERYWVEITGRADLGADLKSPQTNESGQEYWSYSLIKSVRPGDVVLHYFTPSRAITAYSIAGGPVEERAIVWAARGSSARHRAVQPHSRPGWVLPLSEHRALAEPVTLSMLTQRHHEVRASRDWLAATHDGNLYFPFTIYSESHASSVPALLALSRRQAAELLSITERAVSNLRTGRSRPSTRVIEVLLGVEQESRLLAQATRGGEQEKQRAGG
jgi:hypothetical protein